jgi:GT2 family glycosyltransferase
MPKESKFVTVIVLNWNGKRFLQKCIGSLLDQEYLTYEVLLVDNASTDNSIEFVQGLFGNPPKLRILSLQENYGFSKGNNIGIKSCTKSDYVIILNNDTEVEKNFVKKMVQTAEISPEIGSVGPKILFNNKKMWFSQKFTNNGFIVPYFLQTIMNKKLEEISNSFNTNLSNSGCAVLYRKSIIDKIGGFDEDFWSNWEDWDLGYRINIAGFKSVCIPDPLVYHVGGGSEGSSPERFVRIYRNELFMYFKNYDTKSLLFRFPFLLFVFQPIYHLVWFLQRLLARSPELYRGREFDYFISRERALFSFLCNLKIFIKKRYLVQKIRKTSDDEIFDNTECKYII